MNDRAAALIPPSALLAAIGLLACSLLTLGGQQGTPPAQPTDSYALTPQLVPTPGSVWTATGPPATVPAPQTATPMAPASPVPGPSSGPYGVVLVKPDDVLNIRSEPGVSSSIVGVFGPIFAGVMRTGPVAPAGDSLWVQVQRPGGGTGWVNQLYLTQYADPQAFCADARVTALLDRVAAALASSDGDAFSSLVSPAHGLDVRVWRWGTSANYSRAESRLIFNSSYELAWGPAPGSGLETIGTFNDVAMPRLLDVLGKPHERHCNDVLDLATFALEPWPAEYTNINFYNLYRPGTEVYGGLDWRAWLAGVEYVEGEAYLFALIHFQWEP